MKTIVVANRKGGVGKSTIAGTVAAGFAIRGYHVVMIDTDSQGHAARLFGMPKENGLFNLIVNRAKLTDVVRAVDPAVYCPPDVTPAGSLWLVPSDSDTFMIPFKVQSLFALKNRISEMGRVFHFDVAIIDTAPTASMFDGSLYHASDGIIYVTEAETLSFDGLQEGLTEIEALSRERVENGGEAMRILGIVPNKIRAGTLNHRENLTLLGQAQLPGPVWKPIPQRTLWTEATNYGQTIFSYAPRSGETEDAWELVDQAERALREWQAVTV